MKIILFAAAAVGLLTAGAAEKLVPGFWGDVRTEGSGVTFAPRLYDSGWGMCKVNASWKPQPDGACVCSIADDKGKIADVRAQTALTDGKARLEWTFDVRRDYAGNGLYVSVDIPTALFAGGTAAIGGKTFALPADCREQPWIGGAVAREAKLTDAAGSSFALSLAKDGYVSLQDNRKWGSQTYSLRVSVGDKVLKAGERRETALTLSADGGFDGLERGPLVIAKNADWVPLADTTDVVPGSALDFSKLGWIDAPAGKYGRVVAKGAHFEFERKPGVAQRFYGCNLCFSANYLSEKDAEELCARMSRLGYNALRIHHYERDLCDPKDGTAIRPEKMTQLDNLLNACIRHGIYLTTDLFVSRPVPWRACGIDRDGTIPMDQFKELALFDERVRANYLKFAKEFLGHVNPKTGRRWADEPALGFLALINEGNPGNHGYAFMGTQEALLAKWRAWLAARKAESPELYKDIVEAFPANCWENSRQNCAVSLFLADLETGFCEEMRRFIREEIGSQVLLTDMSCWKNPLCYQLTRTHYDYVDDHFYVDHPQFLEKNWQLPSKCPNVNPVRGANLGFEGVARHRLLDRPFTLTEFNYSGPGQFRGVGGMMLGAQAALQDYDGIWRFAWSHSDDGVLASRAMTYFDVARDPLTRATERAVLTLYLRRDLEPLKETFAFVLPEKAVRSNLDCGPHADIRDLWFGWFAKYGSWVGSGKPAFATKSAEFPGACAMKTEDIRKLFPGASPDGPREGGVLIDRAGGVFGVDTPRTQGFFAESGSHKAGGLSATVSLAPAAVWVSSLDAQPVDRAKRLLLTHVTDVQDEGATYADKAKTVLLKWGHLPHMMRAGRAEVELALSGAAKPAVYALNADGSRRGEVPAEWKGGKLRFTADTARDPDQATYVYEITR